jgi:peptidoglycan/LPS O-acetylase OafA/YrhL
MTYKDKDTAENAASGEITPRGTARKFHIDSLDGLRGFAALIVVLSHTSNSDMFFVPLLDLRGIGKSGVFLFFLLSSFLLTLPLLDKGKKTFSLPVMSHYWQRRFFRIYPLYTLYLLTGLITTWLFAMFLSKADAGIPLALDWAGFWRHILLQEGKGVTWSIAVEFKFYFILPFLATAVAYIRGYGLRIILPIFAGSLLLSQIVFPQSAALENDARLLPYMPVFIIGMLLALIQSDTNRQKPYTEGFKQTYLILGYIGAGGIAVMTPIIFSIFAGEVPNNYFHNQFILSAVFWSFVLLSAINVQGAIQSFFKLPLLRFYGAISFSLYLFHPVFIGLIERAELNSYLSAWLVLAASTLTAYISFKFLEKPVSKLKLTQSTISSVFAHR